MLKLLTSESQCNTTINNFSSKVVRLVNKGSAARTLTLKEQPKSVAVTIDTDVNATTLFTLSSGSTDELTTGMILVNSDNTAVINTDTNSVISSIVNTTAFTTNVDIIVANGDASLYAVSSIKTFTMNPNTEVILEKGGSDFLESNNDSDIVAIGIAYR